MSENIESSIELEEQEPSKIYKIFRSPIKLLKSAGNAGKDGISEILKVAFSFGIINAVLVIYALIQLFTHEYANSHVLFFLVVLIIAVASSTFAVFRTYKAAIVNASVTILVNTLGVFKKLSVAIIDLVSDKDTEVELSSGRVMKAVDIGKVVQQKFSDAPKLLKRVVLFVLKRIPWVNYVADLGLDIKSGNKQIAATKLASTIETSIIGSTEGELKGRWKWLLLLANVVVIYFITRLKIAQ
jgi:F0F1-type ATP synthase assembly protein I